MPRRCVVLNCPYAVNEVKRKIHLFRFPQIEILIAKWIEATGRHNWIPNESSVICEAHFKLEDFSNTKIRKRLKPDAVPTEHIFKKSTSANKHVRDTFEKGSCIPKTEKNDSRPDQTHQTQKRLQQSNVPANIVQRENRETQNLEVTANIKTEEGSTMQTGKQENVHIPNEIETKIRKLEEENNKLKCELQFTQETYEKELESQAELLKYLNEHQKRESKKKILTKNRQLKTLRIELKRKTNKIRDLLAITKTILSSDFGEVSSSFLNNLCKNKEKLSHAKRYRLPHVKTMNVHLVNLRKIVSESKNH